MRHEQRFRAIERLLATHAGSQLLKGKAEIYDSAARLCSGVQKQIRTLIFSAGPKAPENFAKTINRRLRELNAAGTPGRCVAVIALNVEDRPENFFKLMEARRAIYVSGGMEQLVPLYLLDTKYPLGFDVLIIDDRHMTIGFNTTKDLAKNNFPILIILRKSPVVPTWKVLIENDPHVFDEIRSTFFPRRINASQ